MEPSTDIIIKPSCVQINEGAGVSLYYIWVVAAGAWTSQAHVLQAIMITQIENAFSHKIGRENIMTITYVHGKQMMNSVG